MTTKKSNPSVNEAICNPGIFWVLIHKSLLPKCTLIIPGLAN